LLLAKGNPKKIHSVADLSKNGIRIANRSLGTGTRLLLDLELKKANLDPQKLNGYQNEKSGHLEIGLEVLSGKVDVAPGIRIVAFLLGLDFLPLRWERFDLLIPKEKFFEKPVQLFLGLLNEKFLGRVYPPNTGYNLESSGKVVFPDN
jgi:molybdate-binding protein